MSLLTVFQSGGQPAVLPIGGPGWGPWPFETGAWDLATVNADSVSCWLNQDLNVFACHGYATLPQHLIGSGLRSARGMVDANRVDVWNNNDYVDGPGLYGTSSFHGLTCAAVHNVDANSTAVRAIWRMRFAGHKSYGGSNPDYEDPLDDGTVGAGSFRGSLVPDPEHGSDSVDLMLDVTQDWADNEVAGVPPAAIVNIDAEPVVGQFHRNHSHVWPVRVRMDKSQAGGARAGWLGGPSTAWPILCEARLFKVTDTSGIVQYIIKLVWYAETNVFDIANQPIAYSADHILLAAYAGSQITPTSFQSPFFHFDPVTSIPIWDEVECTMDASALGSFTFTVKSLDRDFSQTISITGQDPIRSGGLNGVIPVLSLGSNAHIDIGCSYFSTTRYTDLGLSVYPGELGQEFHFLTWSMDECRGEDYEVGASGGSSTFFSTDFSEFMNATNWAQPQSVDIGGWPKDQSDLFAMMTESRADSNHPFITVASHVRNWWSDAWNTVGSINFEFTTAGQQLDSDGVVGPTPWQYQGNEYLNIQAIASGGADVHPILFNGANSGGFFYPDALVAPAVMYKVGFGVISGTGSMEGGTAKFRFRGGGPGHSTDYALPGGAGTYEYWLRLPSPKPHDSAGTTGRRQQCEMVLFTDLVAESDPGAGAGLGTPPVGIGLRFRGFTDITVELFVEGTSVDTIHTLLSGLSVNAIQDVLISSVEAGSNVEFHVWVNGIKVPSNAAGTGDHIVAKSAIDSAGLEHGIGLQVCGSDAVGIPKNGFAHVIATNSFGCGTGRHQGVFHRKNDDSLQDIEVMQDVASNQLLWSNDQVCGANPGDAGQVPSYFSGGRVRISNPNGSPSAVSLPGLTKYFSLIQDGSTESQPFPAVQPNVPLIISGGFPTRLDGEILANETSGGADPDMACWRGVFMRGTADEWIHLDGLAGTVGQLFTGGSAADMFIAKGVNGVLWGNKSNIGGNNIVEDIRVQIILVNDAGTASASTPVLVPTPPITDPSEHFLFKLVLTEEIDTGAGDQRTFTLEAFQGIVGGGFQGVAAATTTLVVPGATWTSHNMGQELGCFYGMAKPDGGDGLLPIPVNTTWMTEISCTVTQGATSPETAFDSLVGTAVGSQEVTIQDVRGVVSSRTFKTITDVRGRVAGDISQRFDLPLSRRLLVFERDENGNVPGSFLSAADGDWYRIGLDDGMGIQWGDPVKNYTEEMLQEHRISPLSINYQPDGTTTMQLRQETISFTGGHLRPGMLIIYIEEVLGRAWQQDPTTEAIYGGNGTKILFRGEITGAQRNRQRSEIVYDARGPEFIASRVDLLDLSDCDVGKVAYNVEPGSIQTPYAVSKNLEFGPGDFVPQHAPQNVGSMLGYGQPDLIGMTLADIIEHFVNQYAQKLNGMGILRLNAAGVMTVANGDGSVTVLGPKSTLEPINIAPLITGWGYDATSSIVWRPNREAFDLVPTETVLSGLVMDILRGFLANLPDVRLRIEPTTMRWSIETTKSLRSITINSSRPGVNIDLADDSTEVYTAAVFSSPWREEHAFDASLKNGTIQPAWLDGVDIEGDWMEPFAQIGKFTGEVTQANNFPYQDPGASNIDGPTSTVLVIKVTVGDDPLAVGSFNGATCKFLDGLAAGHTGTVQSSGQHGGFSGGDQYFDVVIEPPLDGTWGAGVVSVVGSFVEINDDPNEPTTNTASAYRRTWADYVLVDPDSGRVVNNLAPGGSWKLNETLPNGCPTGQADVFNVLPANSAVVDGQIVTTPFPFSSGASSCSPGKSIAALSCGGDIVYSAVRIQEGTWCVRAPETGFAGRAYRDIIEHDGVITAVHSDGLGFVDTNSHFLPHQWEPHGGALTKVLMVGGFKTTFAMFQDGNNYDNINDGIQGQTFSGGWDVDPSDTPQNDQYFEERSLDADQNVAEWHDDAGNTWHTNNGIRFKAVAGDYGARRGCFISRHIPNGSSDASPNTFTPLGLSTSSTKDTQLNNNVQIEAVLRLDPDDAVTSLASVALILRGENGFLEQLRVPPGDIPSGTPTQGFFDETLIKIDTATGDIGGSTGREFQRGIVAHAARMEGYEGVGGSFPADYIPNWISSTSVRQSFREASTPTGGGAYAGLNLLGTDGDVMDARYPNTDEAGQGHTAVPSLTSSASADPFVSAADRYSSPSTTFTAAQKARKRGLELGTTGYVFRYVRGDEPDSLVDSAQLSTHRDRAYPTLFWYHTRVAVDSAGLPVLASDGEPIFEGVKEIIWQGNLSTGVTNASLNNGSDEITIKFSVETPVPNGRSNKLTVSVSPLIPFAFATFMSHQPSRVYHNQVHGPAGGIGKYHWARNIIDGCYSDWNMGFSMVQGASGFGVGVGKVVMTSGEVGFEQDEDTSGPAKVTSFRINQINRPPFNFNHGGISTSQAAELLATDYNANSAKIGYVTESDRHGIRFAHDESEHLPGAHTPVVGDHYRLYVDRGWGIARMAVFEASGLDDPNKVWIFRHMADSALKSAQDRLHVGTVSVQGIAHEVADGAVKVNVSSEDGYTGLEDMEQISGGVTFEFEPTRRTTFNINQDGRGVFSKIDEILSEKARKDAVEQVPSFLSKDNQFNEGKKKSLAPAGLNFTSLPGFGGTSPYTCANNVIVADNVGGGQQDLIAALQQQRDELHRLYILVDANKAPGEEEPDALVGLVHEGEGGSTPSTYAQILKVMEENGRGIGDLVFPDKAYRDETDGQLYGIAAEKNTGKTGVVFAWKPVVSDKAGGYVIDTTKAGRRPREAGSSRITVGTGSPLANSYSITSTFIHPNVSVYAGTGFVAGTGATAVDGDLVTSNNVPGFNVNVSSTDVTISATDDFGPVHVLLTS